MNDIRNVAIIAHVDHGKTTLVDTLLRFSQTKLQKEDSDRDLIMDSNDLEKERGITIFSKNASVQWKGTKINIIDTPGHADFGGEVERVLKMADGCLLLVDAKEGPMPQTRFVLKKALEMNHKVIVVINKIDKSDARIDYVLGETFDLFVELGADEEAAFFPVIYASAKNGLAGTEADITKMKDIEPVFDEILKSVPAPTGDPEENLQVLITNFSYDNFLGRVATGKIFNGKIQQGQTVSVIDIDDEIKTAKISYLMTFEGLGRINATEVSSGDILAIAGVPDINIGDTISSVENPKRLEKIHIEEPTVGMTFSINDSPLAGKEGKFSTSRQVGERLLKELETDVALKVTAELNGKWEVIGRGELHLSILIERMRREGYEFQVGRPKVVTKIVDGKELTPFESVFVEVPEETSGAVIQKLGARNGIMKNMKNEYGIVFVEFEIPTKGLLGYRSEFITDTRGFGIINTTFLEWRTDPGKWKPQDHGSLTAHQAGTVTIFGCLNGQGRGMLFVKPGEYVYKNQVVGRNAKAQDLAINVCKEKVLTNMRSKGSGGVDDHLNSHKEMNLEDALQYISDDEFVEVTPKSVRIRKEKL